MDFWSNFYRLQSQTTVSFSLIISLSALLGISQRFPEVSSHRRSFFPARRSFQNPSSVMLTRSVGKQSREGERQAGGKKKVGKEGEEGEEGAGLEGDVDCRLQFQTYTLLCDVSALGGGDQPLELRDLRLEDNFDQIYDKLIEVTCDDFSGVYERMPLVQYTPEGAGHGGPFVVDLLNFSEFSGHVLRCAQESDEHSPTLHVKLLPDPDYPSDLDEMEDEEQEQDGQPPVNQQPADFADGDPGPEQQSVTEKKGGKGKSEERAGNIGKGKNGKGYREGNNMVDFVVEQEEEGRAVVRVLDGECNLVCRLHPLGSELGLVSAGMNGHRKLLRCHFGNGDSRLAVCMGQHSRLGRQSHLRLVDSSLLEMICSQLPVDSVASIQRRECSVETCEEEGDENIFFVPDGKNGHSVMVFDDGRNTIGAEKPPEEEIDYTSPFWREKHEAREQAREDAGIGCQMIYMCGGHQRLAYVDREDGILNIDSHRNLVHVSSNPKLHDELAVLQQRNLFVVDHTFRIKAQRHSGPWLASSRDLGDVGWPSWSCDGKQLATYGFFELKYLLPTRFMRICDVVLQRAPCGLFDSTSLSPLRMPIQAQPGFGRLSMLSFCPTRPLAVTFWADKQLRVYATGTGGNLKGNLKGKQRASAGPGRQEREHWQLVGALKVDRELHHFDWDPSGRWLVGYWRRHHWREAVRGHVELMMEFDVAPCVLAFDLADMRSPRLHHTWQLPRMSQMLDTSVAAAPGGGCTIAVGQESDGPLYYGIHLISCRATASASAPTAGSSRGAGRSAAV